MVGMGGDETWTRYLAGGNGFLGLSLISDRCLVRVTVRLDSGAKGVITVEFRLALSNKEIVFRRSQF